MTQSLAEFESIPLLTRPFGFVPLHFILHRRALKEPRGPMDSRVSLLKRNRNVMKIGERKPCIFNYGMVMVSPPRIVPIAPQTPNGL